MDTIIVVCHCLHFLSRQTSTGFLASCAQQLTLSSRVHALWNSDPSISNEMQKSHLKKEEKREEMLSSVRKHNLLPPHKSTTGFC